MIGNSYTLCGRRVSSEIPLPDLLAWTGDDRPAELNVTLGPVPPRLNNLAIDRPLLQVSTDGTCRFAISGVAVYLISPTGDQVVIDAAMDPTAPDIRVFLLGTVFGIWCFKRGLLPLHAGCVRIGDGAVALAGASGIGKSTLTAAFLRRGHAVLADDLTVLDVAASGGPMVLPTFPRVKLWRQMMHRLGFPTDGLERTRGMLEKFHLPLDGPAFCTESLPLLASFHLNSGSAPRAVRLAGVNAAAQVGKDVYRNTMAIRLGLRADLLKGTVAAVRAPQGIWSLSRALNAEDEEQRIEEILSRVKG